MVGRQIEQFFFLTGKTPLSHPQTSFVKNDRKVILLEIMGYFNECRRGRMFISNFGTMIKMQCMQTRRGEKFVFDPNV